MASVDVEVKSDFKSCQQLHRSVTAASGSGGLEPPPQDLTQLVKRTISLDKEAFERLQELEGPSKRRGCASWACWPPVALPTSPAYAWWALVMLVLDLTYTAVLCPVSVAFAPRGALISWAFVADFVAGLLFLADVVVNFHVGYVVQHGIQQRVVTSRHAVAKLYIQRGTFVVDALSSLAWFAQFAMLVIAWAGSNADTHVDLANALRIMRILRILRVLFLLKHLYLSHVSGSKKLLGLKPHTLHTIQLFYVSLIIVNFCACIWFFVAREGGFKGSWVNNYAPFISRYSADRASPLTADEVAGIPNVQKWLASIYWASTTILTGTYWMNPGSYTLYGLVASQLGDVATPMQLPDGTEVPVNQFVEDYFGFKHSFIGWAAAIQVAFIILFRALALLAQSKLNFQSR